MEPGGHDGPLSAGVLTEFGSTLSAPVGRIHWANSEMPTYWHGHIEGAIRSGKHAAEEVLQAV